MYEPLYQFLVHGFADASWLTIALIFVAVAQLTVISVTIYLHRCQAHRGVDLHPLVSHPMRFWLWLTTSMVTREWVAIHRKHHARCETEEDPHSPVFFGLKKVLFDGAGLYNASRGDQAMLEHYGRGAPNDFLERHLYTPRATLGPTVLLFVYFAAFGVIGVAIWAMQMLVIPVLAAGVVNGLGHHTGYRNFETDDRATNIVPWGLVCGGEELHNNHHAHPSSARFALRRHELDIGWMVLSVLAKLKLARILRVAPKLDVRANVARPDVETVKALLVHRYAVYKDYFALVVRPTLQAEMHEAGVSLKAIPRRLRQALPSHGRFLDEDHSAHLRELIEAWPATAAVYEFRTRLATIFDNGRQGPEAMIEAVKHWCADAEASGNRALQAFAERLRGYRVVPVALPA